MSGDFTQLKNLAETVKGWDLTGCWPAEDNPVNWQVGRLDEDENRFPVMTIDTADYEQPEDAKLVAAYYAAASPPVLLALIGELERLRDAPPCATDVYKHGQSMVLIGDVHKEAAERICRAMSAITGWRIDWHYIGGRVHMKALPPPPADDERQRFEQGFRSTLKAEGRTQVAIDLLLERRGNGDYYSDRTRSAYEGWLMRAALARIDAGLERS